MSTETDLSNLSPFELARRVGLSIIVATYIIASVVAGAPASPLAEYLTSFFKPIFNYVGLYNNFGVFAPDPAKYNQEFRAVIHFKDGSETTWKFPSLLDWKDNDVMKQLKLPWVEWEYYLLWDPGNVVLLPDAAQYVAYIHRNPKNPPIKVDIYRDYNFVPEPHGDSPPLPANNKTEVVLQYTVKEQDLQ